MSFDRFQLSIRRFVRSLVVAIVCAVVFFTNIYPAAAMGSTPSNPKEGSARLDQIQEKSEEALRNPPQSLDEVQSEANKGLNEIQGAGDVNSMNRPSNSSQATSVEKQIKNVLEKVTGQD